MEILSGCHVISIDPATDQKQQSLDFPSLAVVPPLSQLVYKQTNKAMKQMDMCLQLDHRLVVVRSSISIEQCQCDHSQSFDFPCSHPGCKSCHTHLIANINHIRRITHWHELIQRTTIYGESHTRDIILILCRFFHVQGNYTGLPPLVWPLPIEPSQEALLMGRSTLHIVHHSATVSYVYSERGCKCHILNLDESFWHARL